MEAVSKTKRAIQTLGYIVPSLGIGWIIFGAMLQALYGLQPHPLMFVGLFGAIGLFVAGVIALFSPRIGRIVAVCAVVALSPVMIEWIIALVPMPRVILDPENYIMPVLYFGAVASVLFLPQSFRYSLAIFVVLCLSAAVVASATYAKRVRDGLYDRPYVACFRWRAEPANQLVVTDEIGAIDQKTKAILNAAGIHGTLKWHSGSDENTAPHRMILLFQAKPPEGMKFFFPRAGVVIYAYDGKRLQAYPSNVPTYSSYFHIENLKVENEPDAATLFDQINILNSAWHD